MNGESSSFHTDSDAVAGELSGILKEAVEQIRAVPAPQEAVARVIERAAAWSDAEDTDVQARPVRAGKRRWAFMAAAALVLVAITVVAVAYWMGRQPPSRQAPVNGAAETQGASGGAQAGAHWMGQQAPSGPSPPGVATQTRGATGGLSSVGASVCPDMTVADDATILVSTGPDRPIRLGEALRYSHGRDNTVHVWDWSKSDESRPLKGVHGYSMDVSPGGEWIVTYDARVIDAASGAARQLEAFGRHISGMKFSPDGRTLLVIIREDFGPAAVGTARVLDFPSGKKRFDIAGQSPHIFACAFTADGSQFFLMDKDRFVRRWDAATGEELGRYEPAMANSISAIAVSADAKQVAAAGSRGETYLWDLAGGKLLHKSEAQLRYGPRMHSLAFSPDGSLLAGGASSSLVLWQTDGGTVARQFRYDARGAVHLRFSKDGKRLTSVHEFYGTRKNAGEELTAYPEVREWNVESGEELKSSR